MDDTKQAPKMNDNDGSAPWDRYCIRAAMAWLLTREASMVLRSAADERLSERALLLHQEIRRGCCRTEADFHAAILLQDGGVPADHVIGAIRDHATAIRMTATPSLELDHPVVEAPRKAPVVPFTDTEREMMAQIEEHAMLRAVGLDDVRVTRGHITDAITPESLSMHMGRTGWAFDLDLSGRMTVGDVEVHVPMDVSEASVIMLAAIVNLNQRLHAERRFDAANKDRIQSTKEREDAMRALYPDAQTVSCEEGFGRVLASLSASVVNPNRLATSMCDGVACISVCAGVNVNAELFAVHHPDDHANQVPVFSVLRYMRLTYPDAYATMVHATKQLQDKKREGAS